MVKKKVKSFKNKAISKEIKKGALNINKNILPADINRGVKELNNSVSKFDKDVDDEIKYVEKWVIERRKFFIKLGWVALFVLVLFIISELFLTVKLS